MKWKPIMFFLVVLIITILIGCNQHPNDSILSGTIATIQSTFNNTVSPTLVPKDTSTILPSEPMRTVTPSGTPGPLPTTDQPWSIQMMDADREITIKVGEITSVDVFYSPKELREGEAALTVEFITSNIDVVAFVDKNDVNLEKEHGSSSIKGGMTSPIIRGKSPGIAIVTIRGTSGKYGEVSVTSVVTVVE